MQQNNKIASLSDRQKKQQGEVTAKNWVSFWGRESKQSTWQDEALGAGRLTVVVLQEEVNYKVRFSAIYYR